MKRLSTIVFVLASFILLFFGCNNDTPSPDTGYQTPTATGKVHIVGGG